ncbi:MAG: ABC transporter ATP-binding protein [Candidatus Anammoximicrobium sp.]|nr:ABC transporter ATP-binding protein [Candidatus Anammoximicrobium sp.]
MRWVSFRKAARFGGAKGRPWWIYLWGSASALLTVLLVADVGLILDLIHSSHEGGQSLDGWSFAAWLGMPDQSWGWLDRYEYCLLALLAALLTLATAEALALLVYFRLGELAAWDAVGRLQIGVYEQVRRLGVPDWFEREGRQSEQRLLDKCQVVREGLAAWWTSMPRSFMVAALLLALAAYIDFFLTLLTILLALFVWRLFQRLEARADAGQRQSRAQLAMRQAGVLDAFQTARIVEGLTAIPASDEAFQAACDRYRRDLRQGVTTRVAVRPWLLWLLGLGAALLLLVVGLSPRPTSTGLGVLALALARLALPVIRLRRTVPLVARADEAAAEILAYLDRASGVGQIAGALEIGGVAREIRWENVAIADHAGRPLLTDLSFEIPAGSQAAIVASDCHTPLTVAGLFLRYQDPGTGRILIDGTDLRSVTIPSLRRQIAFAACDGMLFTGTIADNIRCARSNLSQDQIDDAARVCQVLEAIKSLPEGFATTVGPGGTKVAAAVAFRIGLARAVLSAPSVLIVHEPPVPTDETEAQAIDAALEQLRGGRTLIVIPSRLATLRAAERIFLIHQGRLHAAGGHAELLQANALYRHLNYVLFTPFREVVPCGPGEVR